MAIQGKTQRPSAGSPKPADLRQMGLQHRLPAPTIIFTELRWICPLYRGCSGLCSVRLRSPNGPVATLLSLRAVAADRGNRSTPTPLTSIVGSFGSAARSKASFLCMASSAA